MDEHPDDWSLHSSRPFDWRILSDALVSDSSAFSATRTYYWHWTTPYRNDKHESETGSSEPVYLFVSGHPFQFLHQSLCLCLSFPLRSNIHIHRNRQTYRVWLSIYRSGYPRLFVAWFSCLCLLRISPAPHIVFQPSHPSA